MFDELVNLSEESEVSKSEKKSKKADKSEDGQNPGGKGKDQTQNTSKTDDKSKAKESKEAGEKKESKKVEKSEGEEEAPKRKTYKAKYADTDHDLDEDLEFEQPVNGKPEKVKLKELLSDYSGRKNWNEQFQNLSKDRKEVSGLKKQLIDAEEKIKTVFEEKDPQIRIFKMAKLVGMNPLDFRKSILEDNSKMLASWSQMSDAEKTASTHAFENALLKYEASTKADAEAKRQALEQHNAKVNKLLTSHQVTADEFEAQEEFLKDLFTKQGKDLKDVTPEFVIEVNLKNKLWGASQPVFEKLQHAMSQEAMIDFIDKAHFQGLKPADMPEVIDRIFGAGKAKEIIQEKVKQAQEFKTGVKPSYQKQQAASSGPTFFDEM